MFQRVTNKNKAHFMMLEKNKFKHILGIVCKSDIIPYARHLFCLELYVKIQYFRRVFRATIADFPS